jgi:hypothetical protein
MPKVTPAPIPTAPVAAPAFGAAMLERSTGSKLPWMLVIMLGVAVVSLLAYIVIK